MIPNTIRIDIDGQREIYPNIVLSVGDINTYGLILEFYKGGALFDITGYNLAIYATRSGSNTPIPDTGTVTGGKGYYVIKPSMYAYAGETKIEVVLTDGIMSYVTKVLHFTVRSGFSSLGGAVVDEADFTVLSNLIAEAQTAILNANSAAEYANGIKMHQYTIAPSNAVNKDRADLVLTGTDDAAAINAAFTALVALRESDDVAIRVDFLGGDITVEEPIEIPTNFRIYGNGVNLIGVDGYTIILLIGTGVRKGFVDGMNCLGGYYGVVNNGTATINNCNYSNNDTGIINSGTATINNCNCSGNIAGIINNGTATINNCNCSNNSDKGIENYGTNSIIVGNRCLNNGVVNILDEGTDTVLANNIAPEVAL